MGRVQAGTRWRRLLIYYPSPGCRQGTILAPVTAWRRLPGSCGTWPLDIGVCSAARWPPRTTSSRANGRTIFAQEQAAETAPPGPGPADHCNHGGHDRPRRSRPVTAVTAGRFGRGHGGRSERLTRERYCRTTHTGERTSERTDQTAGSAGDTAPPPPGRHRGTLVLPGVLVTSLAGSTFIAGTSPGAFVSVSQSPVSQIGSSWAGQDTWDGVAQVHYTSRLRQS